MSPEASTSRVSHAVRSLCLYPLVSAALWVGLLWPWRREPPAPVQRLLAGSWEERASRTARLRLRLWRLRLRTRPFALADHPLLFPVRAPILNAKRRRAGPDGGRLSTWCASLLPALRYAPGSRVARAHAWHRPERAREAAHYLEARSRNEALQMLWCLRERGGRWHDLHLDKREFHRRCQTAGLPSIPILAVFRDGRGEPTAPGGASAHDALFAKRVTGASGRGAEAWSRHTDGKRFVDGAGRSWTEPELLAHLRARSEREGALLLQPRIRNHPAVTAITGSQALCCVRVITCRFPDGALALVPGWCVLKGAAPDAIVDNVAGGDGPRYVADLETGRLRMRDGSPVPVPPGAPPARIPLWEDTVALCRRAHADAFAAFAAVAWDVGITPDGPVLVEGNLTFMGPGTESTTGPYCGRGPLLDCLEAHLARVGPEDVRRLRAGWSRR